MSHRKQARTRPAGRDSSNQTTASGTICIPKRALIAAGILFLTPWLLIVRTTTATTKSQAATINHPNVTSLGKPGPWGQLMYTKIDIEPPADDVAVDHPNFKPVRWFLQGMNKDQSLAFYRQSGLTDSQMASLSSAVWEVTPTGSYVSPPPDLIMDMSAAVRQAIYTKLDDYPENDAQRVPYSFQPDRLDDELAKSDLKPETQNALRSLLYRQGDSFLFADLQTLLPRIPDHDEKVKLFKTIAHRSTMIVELKIDQSSNIDQIADYWGIGRHSKDVRPLLHSLSRVPGGYSLDIAHLLPDFARRRIFTYPETSTNPVYARRDCHWTSLNFFAAGIPDDKYTKPEEVQRAYSQEYHPIADDPHFGDIVLLMTPNNVLVHSCVYLADDTVFTKNGAIYTQPWTFMRIPDLLAYYNTFYPPDQPLKIVYVRKKSA